MPTRNICNTRTSSQQNHNQGHSSRHATNEYTFHICITRIHTYTHPYQCGRDSRRSGRYTAMKMCCSRSSIWTCGMGRVSVRMCTYKCAEHMRTCDGVSMYINIGNSLKAHPSNHQPIYPSMHLCNHPSIHPWMYTNMHTGLCRCARWLRAEKLGLHPPLHIWHILQAHTEGRYVGTCMCDMSI